MPDIFPRIFHDEFQRPLEINFTRYPPHVSVIYTGHMVIPGRTFSPEMAVVVGHSLIQAASLVRGGAEGEPIRLILHCPKCRVVHVDAGEWETRPHKTHLCLVCGNKWRPCPYPTVGVNSADPKRV